MANPRNRRLARERALQILFGVEFTRNSEEEALESFWLETPANPDVKEFAESLVHLVLQHRDDLDDAIDAALRGWTPDRIGRVERTVLRVAYSELLYVPDVPVPVIINEALEIAKKYGDEEAVPFIHAVLDRLAKQSRDVQPHT